MVKWTGGGSERTFNQSAANGRNELIVLKNSEFQKSGFSGKSPPQRKAR